VSDTFAQVWHFSKQRESHLLMRVWNRLWAISDTSWWGEVITCALYETDKIRTSSPKSKGSHSLAQHTSSQPRCVHVLLHASVLPSLANWSPWKKMTSILVHLLSSGGGHSWCSGESLYTPNSSSNQQTTPILYFLFLLKRDLKVGRSQ
jgi:hypothetical protein